MRIDKFLWCVRLCKTRSIATGLCTSERITMGDKPVKASREVAPGDVFKLRQPPIWRVFEIADIPKNRVGAKLVAQYLRETTGQGELAHLKEIERLNAENRALGASGRPTKRNRRDLDRFKDK